MIFVATMLSACTETGAAPRLIAALADSRVEAREAAMGDLVRVGPSAIGPLEKAILRTEDLEARLRAGYALVRLCPGHEYGMSVIVEGFASEEPALAALATRFVLELGEPFVPRLRQLLADPYIPLVERARATLAKLSAGRVGAPAAGLRLLE
jgi:hypothetical protein